MNGELHPNLKGMKAMYHPFDISSGIIVVFEFENPD